MDEEVDDFLAHYGVPGMKWGKRKASSPEDKARRSNSRQIKKVTRKLNRIDSNSALSGYGLIGYAATKGKKNPYRSMKRATVAKGAAEAAIIIGGTNLLLSAMKLNPSTKRGAQVSTLILAAASTTPYISEYRDVNAANRHSTLNKKLSGLEKEQKRLT